MIKTNQFIIYISNQNKIKNKNKILKKRNHFWGVNKYQKIVNKTKQK
jgi:hypothetical protein